MSNQLDRIEQKLDLILERLPNRRTTNTNADGELALAAHDVRRHRVAEIERLFFTMVNDHENKRADRYKVPKYLRGHPLEPFVEAVTVAVLCNQASLRKIFRTRAASDPADSTPTDRAKAALDDSNLVQICAADTDYSTEALTELALSPAECQKKVPKWLRPKNFKGWTCVERAQPRESITDDDVIKPLPDPCGRRDWDLEDAIAEDHHDEPEEEEAPQEPVRKNVRKVTFGK